jgi:2-polyprenyl-3-methyl-5-hydroxy-6-metoxy-1,4-benzoquinol methylase
MVDPHAHWEKVYATKRPEQVSWYRPHLEISLDLIKSAAPQLEAQVIDVGAGESTLIGDLVALGYVNLCALDISLAALSVAKARLGASAGRVKWLAADVRTVSLDAHRFDVWHDRAVFHFLTRAGDRAAYVRQLERAVKPGGHLIVAAFGPQGPSRCSGLEVVRYDPHALHAEFGAAFTLLEHRSELHRTPAGAIQQFTYCMCRLGSGRNGDG